MGFLPENIESKKNIKILLFDKNYNILILTKKESLLNRYLIIFPNISAYPVLTFGYAVS